MIDNLFNSYKNLTATIIKNIEDDEDIEVLMDERMEILKKIEELNLGKEVLNESYERLGIASIDKALEKHLSEKLQNVKDLIRKNQILRDANKGYASSVRGNNLFSKKV